MSAQSDIERFKALIPQHEAALKEVLEQIDYQMKRVPDCDEQYRAIMEYVEELHKREMDYHHYISECKRLIAFNEQWIKDHPVIVKQHELVF